MFNKKFGTNTNFEPGSETDAVEDSASIRETIDYAIIRAAWDEYVDIKKQDPDYKYGDATPTPAWEALKKVQEYGDFNKFSDDEQHLLRALKKGFLIYADVLHVMIDHHDDEEAGQKFLDKHPDLKVALPRDYSTADKVIEVVIEVIRDYQWQLEQFSIKHIKAIEDGLIKE